MSKFSHDEEDALSERLQRVIYAEFTREEALFPYEEGHVVYKLHKLPPMTVDDFIGNEIWSSVTASNTAEKAGDLAKLICSKFELLQHETAERLSDHLAATEVWLAEQKEISLILAKLVEESMAPVYTVGHFPEMDEVLKSWKDGRVTAVVPTDMDLGIVQDQEDEGDELGFL